MIGFAIAIALLAESCNGQKINAGKYIRDYSTLPMKQSRTLSFTTDEATKMHVDVSPDGQQILFTILGDLYLISEQGGNATQLTRGMAVNTRPLWSPDGKLFCYISDAEGKPQTHVRNVTGDYHKVLIDAPPKIDPSFESDFFSVDQYHWPPTWEPRWLPDGQILSGSHVFSVSGGKTKIDSTFINFYTGDNNIVGYVGNNIYSIYYVDDELVLNRSDLDGRLQEKIEPFKKYKGENLGNFQLSRDGKLLAFRRSTVNNMTIISVMNLTDQTVKDVVSFNTFYECRLGESTYYVHYSFSPNSQFIYLSYSGKIHKIAVDGSSKSIVPFSANVLFDMGSLIMNKFGISLESKKVIATRNANRSNDGKKLTFSALKKIYILDVASGKTDVLVDGPGVLFEPHFSPDNRYIAFASNDSSESGKLFMIEPDKIGEVPKLIKEFGSKIEDFAWSPDGKFIAILTESAKGSSWNQLSVINLKDGSTETFKDELIGSDIVFTSDNELIYSNVIKHFTSSFYRLNLLNKQEVKIFEINHKGKGFYNGGFYISPDLRFLTFTYSNDLFITPIENLKKLDLNSNNNKIVRFACNATDLHWEQNGKVVSWSFGNQYYALSLDKIISEFEKKSVIEDPYRAVPFDFVVTNISPENVVKIDFSYQPIHQKGLLAFTGAKIISMEGSDVISNGTILIQDSRIKKIGRSQDVTIPVGARIIDVSGKTIIPGMFDLHCHVQREHDINFEEEPELRTYFAYGVTTALDPSSSFDMAAYTEILDAGLAKGPRFFSVGKSVGPAYQAAVANLEYAEKEVEERKRMGSIVIKQYRQKTRTQQLWMQMACNQAGINMTSEGGHSFLENIALIKNGTPKIEHFPFAGFGTHYKDVRYLLTNCKTIYTVTNTVYQGDYFRRTFPEQTEKFKRINPKEYDLVIKEQFNPSDTSEPDGLRREETDVKNLYSDSTAFALGGHGDEPGAGIKFHYELWSKSIFGGLGNFEILQMATINGAKAIGVEKDLGSLAVGKIADMVILDKDPLADIKNTIAIKYIVKNGIIYNGNTLKIE